MISLPASVPGPSKCLSAGPAPFSCRSDNTPCIKYSSLSLSSRTQVFRAATLTEVFSVIFPYQELSFSTSVSRRRSFSFSSPWPERTEGNTFPTSGIQAKAFKRNEGNKKNKGSGKPDTVKKQSPWTDDSAVSTTSSKLNRKSSGGRRRGSSSNGATRERITEDSHSQSRHAPERGKHKKLSTETQDTPRILVSASMPVETEVVLQTQEPATTPLWNTFGSSLCGVWRGVGAAFSPITAEMEPIALGDQNEYLYDCRVSSTVEEIQGTGGSSFHRKTIWAVGNPYGEQSKRDLKVQLIDEVSDEEVQIQEDTKEDFVGSDGGHDSPTGEMSLGEDGGTSVLPASSLHELSFSMEGTPQPTSSCAGTQERKISANLDIQDISHENIMEEDVMGLEPGLVFFEDGSYSRGPVELLVGETDSSDFASPTYKIEQCLVRGGHTRLRLVHTIAVEGRGEEIQLLRVAVYEEEWMGPCHMESISGTGGSHLKLFSQRKRPKPQELAGSWKVFEVSATAVALKEPAEGAAIERPSYVYLSMETQKRRLLPETPVHFIDEDILDMQFVTILWLPGGITAYVDIKEDGVLTVGVGWHSDDGINLVMERDYSANGKLYEVRTKSELKGGWSGGRM